MVKNLPEMQKTRFDPWVRKIPLEKGMGILSSILDWRIPQTAEPSGLHTVHGVAKSWTRQQLTHIQKAKRYNCILGLFICTKMHFVCTKMLIHK